MVLGWVGGLNSYGHLLARFDSLGTPRWVRDFGNSRALNTVRCLALPDNGALLVLNVNDPVLGTNNNPVSRANAIRVDSLGNVLWQRQYGAFYDNFTAAEPLPDGTFALVGSRTVLRPNPARFESRPWVVRITLEGDTVRTTVVPSAIDGEVPYAVAVGPGNTLLLGGSAARPTDRITDPWLAQLDSTGRRLWSQRIAPTRSTDLISGVIRAIYPLAAPGQLLVAGSHAGPLTRPYDVYAPENGYLAQFGALPNGAGAAPAWEQHFTGGRGGGAQSAYALGPNRVLTVATNGYLPPPQQRNNENIILTRFTNLPALYQPDYCARPPVAFFAATATGPATVQVLDASTAGPRHARLLVYRWAWGDGTASSGPAPGPHTYATPPRPGTAVTLTVTNHLGCTSTRTEYPFGRPSATQAGQALASRLTLWPNPSAGAVRMELPGLEPQPAVLLNLLNPLGQVVQRGTAPVRQGTATAVLELGRLPAGLYLVRLEAREGTVLRRVVKE